jgi:ribonuclease G
MTKEMVVSASSQDTKIAILEDGQLVEVYFEREQEYSLAGSIYKGRVTRILPGMQSAFVNIGLERDAFLYVSDFLEQVEEYDRVGTTGPERESSRRTARREEPEAAGAPPGESPASADPSLADAGPVAEPPAAAAALPRESFQDRPDRSGPRTEPGGHREKPRRFSRRSRRHRGRPRGIPESKYARSGPPAEEPPAEAQSASASAAPILLPGESFAKYRDQSLAPGLPQLPRSAEPSAEIVAEQAAGMTPAPAAEVSPPVSSSGTNTLPEIAAEQGPDLESRVLQQSYWPGAGRREMLEAPVSPPESEAEEAGSQTSISVQEAMEALREEKIIGELEEEASEMEESDTEPAAQTESASEADEFPGWALLEDRVLDVIDDAEPDSPDPDAAGAAESPEPGVEEPSATTAPASAEGEEAPPVGPRESPRQASVRERASHSRFQRKQRWEARRAARSEQGRRRPRTSDREAPKPLIGDMLKEGQEIIVQIAKEPLGKKGARITSHIALPGRYIVYMPTLDHVGVSRKISSDEERHRLKRIIVEQTRNLSGGFIVRTAGEGHSEEDLRQDVQFLVKLWSEIKAKAERSAAPALLHHDLDLTLRTLRDQISDEYQTIWVDNEQAYEQIVSLVQKFQPSLVSRVRLYTKDIPLFEETGVQDEINKALKPKVWLKSGGYIVINQTEALVAIDVNTGKFVGKSNRLEDTIVKTNVEAIQEIVRQIRLRDLGGIIVIDFIDMDERKNRQKVMSTLEEAMRADKAPSKILSFNEFGLLAITRKRVRQSLERTLCQPCAYCTGSGYVKSPATVSLEILTEAKKMASELEGKQVTLRVNPEVGKALKSRVHGVLEALEEITGRGVIIRNDEAVHIENFYFD